MNEGVTNNDVAAEEELPALRARLAEAERRLRRISVLKHGAADWQDAAKRAVFLADDYFLNASTPTVPDPAEGLAKALGRALSVVRVDARHDVGDDQLQVILAQGEAALAAYRASKGAS